MTRPREPDRAISTVIGTIVIAGVVVAALATYQLTVVPQRTEEAEARHMETVADDMSDLATDLLDADRVASEAPKSSPVSLSRGGSVVGGGEPDPGALSFEAGSGSFGLSSPNLNVVTRDGTALLSGRSGGWQPVEDGQRIEALVQLLGLHVRVEDPGPAEGDEVGIVAGDVEGLYAGELGISANVTDTHIGLVVRTDEPPSPGTTVYEDHVLSLPADQWDGDHQVDATADLYGFAPLLGDATKPATLTLHDGGLDASYRIAYERQVAPGLTTLVGEGRVLEDVNRTFRTGALVYEAENRYYPQQSLRVQHGALVRSQADGASFAIEPAFQADAANGIARLTLDVPSLQGASDTVSGDGIATVRTTTVDQERFGATAGQLGLAFATDHAELWADFLDRELTEAGLTSQDCPPTSADSDCQFELTTGPGSVELTVHGPHAQDDDPSDPERDLYVNVEHGTIRTEVQR